MAATSSPNPDRFNPENQRELERVSEAAFGLDGLDGFEPDAGGIYSVERPRPLVCALAEEAISGGWLGRTQWEVAEKLTKLRDRAWLSRARYQGRISLALFLRLWNHPERPKDSCVTEDRLRSEMNRSAAIAIARTITRRLPRQWDLAPEFLSELNYELGCAVLDAASDWPRIQQFARHDAAGRILSRVCDANAQLIIPPWYTPIQLRFARKEVARLCGDSTAAFTRLEYLSTRWRGVLIATADLMESIWNREKNDAA